MIRRTTMDGAFASFVPRGPGCFSAAQVAGRACAVGRRGVVAFGKKSRKSKKELARNTPPRKQQSPAPAEKEASPKDGAFPLDGQVAAGTYAPPVLDIDELSTSTTAKETTESVGLADEPTAPKQQRKRLRRSQALGSTKRAIENQEAASAQAGTPGADVDEKAIKDMAKAFRLDSKETLLEIEKDPNYLFQPSVLNPSNSDYSLVSAALGRGSMNKQGTYLLPYLQNGHLAILLATLAATFVYFPGFPLTEFSEESRVILSYGLEINSSINLLLAVWAYIAAKKRAGQIPWFWALKTMALGGLALDELRSNAPLEAGQQTPSPK